MRIRGALVWIVACASALSLLSALAAPPVRAADYGKGGYFGINAAYGIDLFSTELANAFGVTPIPVSYDNSWGLNTRLGYRLIKPLSVELQYEWMHGIDISSVGVPIGTWKPHTLTANLKLSLPIWRIQPYLLAGGGVGIWSIEFSPTAAAALGQSQVDSTGFAFRGGAGLDLFLTESVALNAEGTAVLNTSEFTAPTSASQTQLYYFSISGGLSFYF